MNQKPDGSVRLPGEFDVAPAFLDSIRHQTNVRIPMLVPNTLYRAKDILGKAYWQSLSKWEALLAGHCIAYLAMRDELPLRKAGKRPDNSIVYVLS